MTAEEAIALFQKKVDAGQALNLKTGATGTMSDATRDSIISTVRNAYRRAADTSDLTQIKHEAVAPILEAAVVEDAREHGRTHPHNEANRVRRYLATVEGRVRDRPHHLSASIPQAWTDLFEKAQQIDHFRQSGAAVRRIAQAAALYGKVYRPEDLPACRERVIEWLVQSGLSRRLGSDYCAWYGRIRAEMGEAKQESLPDLRMSPLKERGVRGLPDIVERLERAGSTVTPRDLTVMETLAVVAPAAHAALQSYVGDPDECRRRRGDSWKKRARGSISRFMAAAIQNERVMSFLAERDLDEHTVRPIDLVLLEMPSRQIEAVREKDWEARYLNRDTGGVVTVQEPIFRMLAEDMAIESAARSPLLVGNGSTDATLYTDALLQDVSQLLLLAKHEGEKRLFLHRPELREQAELRVKAFRTHAKKINKELGIRGKKKKEKILLQVTLPQLAALGLPALLNRVEKLEQQYFLAFERHGSAHKATQAAKRRYHAAELGYVILALFLEDGMRLANYTGARVGAGALRDEMVERTTAGGDVVRSRIHIMPSLKLDPEGAAVGFRHLEIAFHGDDHPIPRLKIDQRDGNPRSRANNVQGWLLDLDRFWTYFTGQRVEKLVARGLVPTVEEYDVLTDLEQWHFALFPSGAESKKSYNVVTGCTTAGPLRKAFGRALLWCARNALGRDLPSWGPELHEQYRALFSPHIARLLIGTYWYGIREMAPYVMGLIDDTREIIAKRYSVTEPSLTNLTGWEHAQFLDTLVDRAREEQRPLVLGEVREFFEQQRIPMETWPPALR